MSGISIATFNVNSVKARLGNLLAWLDAARPDIVFLQELKCTDDTFPAMEIEERGYNIATHGQKTYNGVAILSRIALEAPHSMAMAESDHKRHIAVRLPDGRELHNFYVPAGGDIPDAEQNPAYGFKLRFVEAMTDWSKARKNAAPAIIVGDFNIAPHEHDVWSSRQLRNVVSHTEPEITRLNALLSSHSWCDVGRHFVPREQKLYSWWSYRNRDWRKSDRGRRLDHIWVSPTLAPALKTFEALKDARDWQIEGGCGPSDHVPLMMEIA